jgi:hypothetical protein
MVKQEAASRLSRERWIAGALKVIGESGLEAVAVEPLAVRLGVTKGSARRQRSLLTLHQSLTRRSAFGRSSPSRWSTATMSERK